MRCVVTYLTQADPGFRKVDEQAVLRPPPSGSDLLQSEIVPVLLEVDLDNKGNGIDCRTWGKRKVSFDIFLSP